MKIDEIKIAKRIRRHTLKIDELAADIKKHGLINPITVMEVDGGYQLLAGLRRLRAAQTLGWKEIEVTVLSPKDAEEALRIEHSENEQRTEFNFSDRMEYARLIEEIEQAKAKERKSIGGQGGFKEDVDVHPHLEEGKTRTKVGEKIGMSGRQYSRAKYIADNASEDIIDELDRGERTIFRTYDELRSAEKVVPKVETPTPVPESDRERAIRAESELDAMKYRQHNEIYHRDSIIQNLNMQIAGLEAELAEANARIKELEEQNSEFIK